MAVRNDSELQEIAAECAAYRGLFLGHPVDNYLDNQRQAIAVLKRELEAKA